MSCILTDNERDYVVDIPVGHWVLNSMPSFSYEEWLEAIRLAGKRREMRPELVDKILTSLERMPALTDRQKAVISYSTGKDSDCIFMLAAMKYPKDRILPLFCDTKDEWEDSYAHLPAFIKWMDIPVITLHTEGIHELLRYRMPFYPMQKRRHCTKELKILPQRDFLDFMGFGQVRYDKQKPTMRDNKGNKPIKAKYPAPQMFSGERWAESAARADLPFDERNADLLRWTHRPVLDWNIEDVWEFKFWMQAPINGVYLKGVKRAACAGCPFASREEIYLLGKYHPAHLQEWVKTEAAIGHPRGGTKREATQSFKAIYDSLVERDELGILAI